MAAADRTSGDSTPEPRDLVTVREAAQQAGVTIDRVHKWVHRGAVPASPGRHGQLVSVAAVCAQRDALAPPPDSAAYVLPFVAARQLGLRAAHVHYWVSRSTVASTPSRYGRLVRLADVQALAAQRQPARRVGPLSTTGGEDGLVSWQVRELAAKETYALRRAVSADDRTDLPHVRHDLDDAPGTWHLGAVDDAGRVIAIASYYAVACPSRPGASSPVQLQFMAVDPVLQGRGVGSAVLAEALRRLRAKGATLLWASARESALPFYRRFGFTVVADSRVVPAATGRPHYLILLDLA
jgi:predicted N-acetyltransferase YhbS